MAKCFIAMLAVLALLSGCLACAESTDVTAYNGKRIGVATGSVFDVIVKKNLPDAEIVYLDASGNLIAAL